MVIKRKVESEAEREKIISKGAKVKSDEKNFKRVVYSLRISPALLERIDNRIKDKDGLSRNRWILEAIEDKING